MKLSVRTNIWCLLCILALQSCEKRNPKLKETIIVRDEKVGKNAKEISEIKTNAELSTQIETEPLSEDALNKISIPIKNNDSLLYLTANMKADHRIFGYSQPNINSKKLILFSIFTNEVENNPFKCKYGSYYDIDRYSQKFILKYRRPEGNFIQAEIKDSLGKTENIYFEKKWVILN